MAEQHSSAVPAVLVGVDGSKASLVAVDWAARAASESGHALFLCLVMPADHFYWLPAETALTDELRARGEHILRQARDRALSAYPQLHTIFELVSGQPAEQLIQLVGPDDLLVLGSHGTGWFQRLVIGSTCSQVAAHARGTVVATRTTDYRADGPVLVGVDDSEPAHRALAFAFATAQRLGRDLHIVHAFSMPPTMPAHGVILMEPPEAAGRLAAIDILDTILAGWADKYPEVSVRREVVRGNAGQALVEASRDASLLVVGSRGHGGFAGLVLGSVSQHVLASATCPVAITH
jgi:nucleotide-binding universal stress UspA family protein